MNFNENYPVYFHEISAVSFVRPGSVSMFNLIWLLPGWEGGVIGITQKRIVSVYFLNKRFAMRYHSIYTHVQIFSFKTSIKSILKHTNYHNLT